MTMLATTTTTTTTTTTSRQRARRSYGVIFVDAGEVRVEFSYNEDAVRRLRPICWTYGGGFARDQHGGYWHVSLAGLRAVIDSLSNFTISPEARQFAAEQAWTA